MDNTNFRRTAIVVAAALLLAGAGAAFAQLQTGNLYGTVSDNNGQALPGVTVTLTGIGATQVQVTNAEGQFRFLGLAPGRYSIKAELEGFSTVDYPNISITVGRNTSLEITLTPAVEEVITVTSESPLLDERKISTGTTVTQTELEKIPTARDPWVILQQTPGVLVDRINVGGNESGQQSTYASPGTTNDNSVWAMDGVVITDMGAIGSSPTYYNFDAFEEMQVTTGGTDVSLATGGVTMNMVTKRGTNEWRGSGRYLLTDDQWQAGTKFSSSDLAPGQPPFQQGNAIVQIQDRGVEVGGPILRDKLWVWGSWGGQKIDLLTLAGVRGSTGPGSHDTTDLKNYAAKLNAQLGANNSATLFYNYGDKQKSGRNAGPTRPAPTTWNQTGPTDIEKVEDTHIFNSNFYLTGMASHVGGGFQLAPVGGGIGDPSFPNVVRLPGSIWQNSYLLYQTDRPQDQYKVDGNYFFNTGTTSHELRFGVGYRNIKVDSFSTWPGQQLVGLASNRLPTSFCGGNPNCYLGFNRTDRNVSDEVKYTSAYAQDTLTFGNFTANVGLRYDKQDGTNNASNIPAPPIPFQTPDGDPLVSGGTFAGGDPGFTWDSVTPRLGLTYALGESRQTLLRASYSRFADQLASAVVSNTNPANYQYGYFAWSDNGDFALTPDEIAFYFAYNGIDPTNPGLHRLNATDSGLKAPTTDELVLSVEHALLPEFVVGLSATWRKYNDVIELQRLIVDDGSPAGSIGRPDTPADYVLTQNLSGNLPDGTAFSVPIYTLADGRTYNGGTFYNNGDRSQDYLGISITFNKRLANRWLLRGHVTSSDWTWNVPGSARRDPNLYLPGNYVDGGDVLVGAGTTSGSKGNVFINSKWSADVSGLYQIAPDRPWGFNVAANINARQGYALPYNVQLDPGDAISTRNVLVVHDVTKYRNTDIYILNARIEKEFTFSDWGLTLSVDAFNLFNNQDVLQRETNISGFLTDVGDPTCGGDLSDCEVGSGADNYVREIVSPQVFRIGARINFR
jgi:outer membrane receptor protein involved in Fe transport